MGSIEFPQQTRIAWIFQELSNAIAALTAERDALMRHVEDLKGLLEEERQAKLRIKHE